MSNTNKHGLSRNIPPSIKRQVRQECGFGCVLCGNAIYEYEHIDPEWAEAKKHSPDCMALLCGSHHDQVSKGLISKDSVKNARKQPFSHEAGQSEFVLDIAPGENCIISIGNTEFIGIRHIIKIDGQIILGVEAPEEDHSPPVISADFYDQNNDLIAGINHNEWFGNASVFDIEQVGRRLSVRSDKTNVDLSIVISPPNKILIDKLNLNYNGKRIKGDTNNGFLYSSAGASFKVDTDKRQIKQAPFGISIDDSGVSVGSDQAIRFVDEAGNVSDLPGARKAIGAHIKDLDKKEYEKESGEKFPDFIPKGEKITRLTEGKGYGEHGMAIEFAVPKPVPVEAVVPKVGRNKPCPCGSGKKYKHCHYRS